jgi:hypothetical protein
MWVRGAHSARRHRTGTGRSDYDPQGLPERTILDAEVMEFGPVTYPANVGATAGLRLRWTPARRQRALVLLRSPD